MSVMPKRPSNRKSGMPKRHSDRDNHKSMLRAMTIKQKLIPDNITVDTTDALADWGIFKDVYRRVNEEINALTEKGYQNICVTSNWDRYDNCGYDFIISFQRPMTEKELEVERKSKTARRERVKKDREQAKANELALLAKLKAKYE